MLLRQFDQERPRHLHQEKIERAAQIGTIIIRQVSDINRAFLELLARGVMLVKNTPPMTTTLRDADQETAIVGCGHDLPEMRILAPFAEKLDPRAAQLLILVEFAGGTAEHIDLRFRLQRNRQRLKHVDRSGI
ncbi:hypothetical protein [Tardiphaga sp. 709]|uniref:hypothetical protein n=1 Tax=Tardiphaga sp. 709 TaxID=3076039 RepID=UPI0028E5D107|nr:hypothetical protein [Tardiphaga sp. 709]